MSKIKTNLLPLTLIILIPIVNIFYFLLNNSSRGIYSLVTDIDTNIPFVKQFAVPYIIWYPFLVLCLIYFCFCYRSTYYRVILSLIIGMLMSFIIYYFFQTSVPRPVLTGDDLLTSLVRIVYSNDEPFNCFPSIHVLTSYLMMRGIRDCHEKLSIPKIIIYTVAVLIILSTQFIKQHVILDLVSGVCIGEGIYRSVSLLLSIKFSHTSITMTSAVRLPEEQS